MCIVKNICGIIISITSIFGCKNMLEYVSFNIILLFHKVHYFHGAVLQLSPPQGPHSSCFDHGLSVQRLGTPSHSHITLIVSHDFLFGKLSLNSGCFLETSLSKVYLASNIHMISYISHEEEQTEYHSTFRSLMKSIRVFCQVPETRSLL